MIGRTLGHYRIEAQLGAGGMGVVYRAVDTKLQRSVAIKFLTDASDAGARARLLAEARAVSALNHPNICTIHEVDESGGDAFLVMELVDGRPLRTAIPPKGLAVDAVLRYGAQIADALAHAHEHGIVHRDLKSANVMLTPDGRVKVLDFGLARRLSHETLDEITRSRTVVESGSVSGTLSYMAPEVLRAEPASPASDVWALGVLLHEMATGRPPFTGRTPFELTAAILHEPVPPLPAKVPAAVRRVIATCLTKEAEQRYQHASEVRAALETVRSALPARKSRWLLGATAAVVVVLAVALGRELRRPPTPVAPREQAAQPMKLRRSVAVLGFRSLTGRADDSWLSTALCEMLTTELASGETLRTIPGESVARMKRELGVPDAESLAQDTLSRIRSNLGTDLVVLGSYMRVPESGGQIRLDLRIQDAKAGETIAAISETGTEGQILDVVTRAGATLREKLGLAVLSTAQAAEVRASMPSSEEAVRLYAEGLGRLRELDALQARDLLEKAVAADGGHALAYSALAEAWRTLGYDEKAREAAKRANDLAEPLSSEDQLSIQSRWLETNADWDRAITTTRRLVARFPDNLDYGLRLADIQTLAGRGADALATLDALRKLPPPSSDDPRIDLAEASAARALSDFKRQRAAAARAVEKGSSTGARLLVARARLNEGRALQGLGDPKGALAAFEEAERTFAAAGERWGVADALNSRAIVTATGGDLPGARELFTQVLATWREIGNKNGVASALNNLAIGYKQQGDFVRARQLYEESLSIRREIADKRGMSGVLNNIAGLVKSRGDFAASRQVDEQALAICREIGEKSGIAVSLNNLGIDAYEVGDLAGAGKRYAEALALYREIGQKSGVARVLHNQGILLHAQGRLADATRCFEEALALRRELQERSGIAHTLFSSGEVLASQARVADARRNFEESQKLREELAEPTVTGNLLALAGLCLDESRPDSAAALATHAIAESRRVKQRDDEAVAQATLADCLVARGDTAAARAAVAQATELSASSQLFATQFDVALASARVDAAAGSSAAAAAALQALVDRVHRLGGLEYEYEARLALGQIEAAANSRGAAARLQTLESDARSRGFLRVAAQAADLRVHSRAPAAGR